MHLFFGVMYLGVTFLGVLFPVFPPKLVADTGQFHPCNCCGCQWLCSRCRIGATQPECCASFFPSGQQNIFFMQESTNQLPLPDSTNFSNTKSQLNLPSNDETHFTTITIQIFVHLFLLNFTFTVHLNSLISYL